jgi:small redox-active disulfide protein 2
MRIEILGSGCSKCKTLEKLTREVVAEAKIEAEISKVDDFAKIAAYGVMVTPGLVINQRVVLNGRVPSKSELLSLIKGE